MKYFFSTIFIMSSIANASLVINTQSIYGVDNRSEVDSYPNKEIAALASSVAAQVETVDILPSGENAVELKSFLLSEKMRVCKEERFSEQNTVSHCTGFLIAKDLLVTASHCAIKEGSCEKFNWIFDYKNTSNIIPNENLYKCKKIEVLDAGNDYAIIRLDRETNRAPLKLKTKSGGGLFKKKPELAVIGTPTGLPLKITDNAKEVNVQDDSRKLGANFFYVNADTFGGNSGSPIFDMETKEVEGILVSGNEDYKFDSNTQCFKTRSYNESGRDGAEVAVRAKAIRMK